MYLNQASGIKGVTICNKNYDCGPVSDSVCPTSYATGVCDVCDKDCSPYSGTPTETDCGNTRDDDCDGKTDCADSDCAGKTGPNSVTCCQSASNCQSNGWYCNKANSAVKEYRNYGCSNNACSYSESSKEDCSTKLSVDSDNSPTAFTTQGTVTDYVTCSAGSCTNNPNTYTDACTSSSLLTEYGASGATFTSSSKNCDDYDLSSCWCSPSSSVLNRNCDDWNCGNGRCQDSGSDFTASSQTCGSSNQCSLSSSPCAGFKCYRTNSGSWSWAASAETTETSCNDGFDNDCDGYKDAEDDNCQLTLRLSPNPANPNQVVTASIVQSYSSGTIIIKDWRGCNDPSALEICRFSPPTSSCTFRAPTNSQFTYGYWACIGKNKDDEVLSVTGVPDHCSSQNTHTANDDTQPSKYRHFYSTSTASWNFEDCDWLDTANCRNECSTATGDIDNTCDNFHCNNKACIDSGSDWIRTTKVQDCSDTCSGETTTSFQNSDGDLTDYELCSAGQSNCPSSAKHDSCSGDTLTEYYCSGADSTSTTKNCNDFDGWQCNSNTREFRDYGCFDPNAPNGAYCKYTVTSTEDCSAKASTDSDGSATAYTIAGTVTDFTTCSPANCNSNSLADSCSGTILTEYGTSGNTFTPATFECQNLETTYCSNDRFFRNEWQCSGTPGFCNDAAQDTRIGTNTDNDAKDKECGDSLCDNAAGVYDSTKTATETNCNDGLDNDCDSITDCADSDCAGKNGPNSVTCCQSASTCAQSNCVIESCVNNACTYTNRNSCDSTECPAGKFCDSAGGNCKSADESSNVCLNCVADQTSGFVWTWTPPKHEDAGKAYSTNIDVFTSLFNSNAGPCSALSCSKIGNDCRCFDVNDNTLNHKPALTTGNCCGNDANEFFKPDYFGGECTNNVNDCVWGTGDAQASNTGNAEWWCFQHEWNQCTDSAIGRKAGGVTCAGVSGNNVWTPNPKPESQYSCADGLDNDGDGTIDCGDSDCAGQNGATRRCCQSASDCVQDDCVIESCIANACSYTNRQLGDGTECVQTGDTGTSSYCNSAGGDCKFADEDAAVCNFVPDKTPRNWQWLNGKPTRNNMVDAGKAYGSQFFDSTPSACSLASCSTSGECNCYSKVSKSTIVKRIPPISTGNCCGDDASEFLKTDYFGAECVDAADKCVWSDGNAQPAQSGNKQWWCNPGDWYECNDANIGMHDPPEGMCCAGVVGNNAWTPMPTQGENTYSCSDGLDNDCDGRIDGNNGANSDSDCCTLSEAAETSCDGLDNDCDGTIDEGCDDDNDDYCDSGMTIVGTPAVCPSGGNDCNDNNANINPGRAEVCTNSLDDNCNSLVDCQDSACDGTISGYVRNRESQAIQSATVSGNANLTLVKSTTTNQQGSYSLAINCGAYDLIASHAEYLPKVDAVTLLPNQQLTRDFYLDIGTSCESDCTFLYDNIIHASCDGKNGCTFYDSIAKASCDNSQPGWVRDYNSSHYVVCAPGSPQPKIEIQASVSCSSRTLVKVTRIVVYNGKPVKLVVATCG